MPRQYQLVRALGPARKAELTATFERLIAETLKPKYLPEVRPATGRNYPVDILGRWRGENYSFITRFRSGFDDNAGEEFDAPFARLDHFGGSFAVMWYRHTGRWWCLRTDLPLEEALAMVAEEPALRPPV
jgi:hypothetical protein